MTGRRLRTDSESAQQGFGDPESARRRHVLRETIEAFEHADPPDRYHRLAQANLERWRSETGATHEPNARIEVVPGDWGEVTQALTKTYGVCFAVLNMANAFVPGGAYVEGAIAQEENLFRRTDCHFRIRSAEFDGLLDRYTAQMTALLSAQDGAVYLDTGQPRVCIRGAEDRQSPDLGYPWLPEDQVFPFYELRAAAQDLRDGSDFNESEARKRIAAQLDTLRDRELRHAVLSAFGCGAFRNPAGQVAGIYRDEIQARSSDFALIAFAIFSPGYGPDNYTPFAEIFAEQ